MDIQTLGTERRENVFTRVILFIMFTFLSIYPFGAAAIRMVMGYREFWDVFTLSVMALTVGLCFAMCIALMLSVDRRMNRARAVGICLFLYAASLVIRIWCSYFLQSEPVSDFNNIFQYAKGELSDNEALTSISRFSYLGAYALVLRGVFLFFQPTVLTAQVFNAAVLAVIPVCLFLCIRKWMRNDRPAIAAAMLYTLNPSMVIYSSILSCEHIAQVFVAVFLLVHAYWADTPYDLKKKYALSVIMGVTLALLNLFKPILIIFAAAFIMASFCYEMIPTLRCIWKKRERAQNRMVQILGSIVLVLVTALFINKLCIIGVQITISGEVVENGGHSLGSLLYAGLNPVNKGTFSNEVYGRIHEVTSLCGSKMEVTKVLVRELMDLYDGDISSLWDVLIYKHDKVWCEEAVFYWWTRASEGIAQGETVGTFLFEILPTLFGAMLYAFCSICLLFMALWTIRGKGMYGTGGQNLFVCVGSVFLYSFMLMLIETQARYKSNIMPYICCMSGVGIWISGEYIKNGAIRIKESWIQRKGIEK